MVCWLKRGEMTEMRMGGLHFNKPSVPGKIS